MNIILPVDSESESQSSHRKKSLILAGFWGRGNAGDEAMLQCIIETLGDIFDYVLCVDEHGAYGDFWKWYPYAGKLIIHQAQVDGLTRVRDPAGLLVGGGGLPLGFAAGQAIQALSQGLPTAVAGIDGWEEVSDVTNPASAQAKRFLEGFGHVFFRTRRGLEIVERAGFAQEMHHGADWALNLMTDTSDDVLDQKSRAIVVLREWPRETLVSDYNEQIRHLLSALSDGGYVPIFVPYSPEDERFLAETGVGKFAPVERSWWNPRRLKQLSACSGLTISIGRLHPMIFAAPTARAVMTIAQPMAGAANEPDAKLRDMAAELGADVFSTVAAAVEAIATGAARPADQQKVAAAKARLDQQANELRRFFATPANVTPG